MTTGSTGSPLAHIVLCAFIMVALTGCVSSPSSQYPQTSASEPLPLADASPFVVEPLAEEPTPAAEAAETIRTHPLIERALGALGTRYRYGGGSLETGFDCSGFVRWIYHDIAAQLPRSAQALSQVEATEVTPDALQPADIVFFRINRSRAITHVGMYVGNGQFIHAPSSGGRVRIESMETPYWRARLVRARRWNVR
jgi:cell wall-associated NlpC family hydrolase